MPRCAPPVDRARHVENHRNLRIDLGESVVACNGEAPGRYLAVVGIASGTDQGVLDSRSDLNLFYARGVNVKHSLIRRRNK